MVSLVDKVGYVRLLFKRIKKSFSRFEDVISLKIGIEIIDSTFVSFI